jgi:hypothetical protein
MTEDKRHAEYDCKWRQQRRTSDPPKPKTRLSEQEALNRARALAADMALVDLLCSAILEETVTDGGRLRVIWSITTTTIDTMLVVTLDDATGDLVGMEYKSGFQSDC